MAASCRASFLLCLLFVLLPWTNATNVQYCDHSADYGVKVTGVNISPEPVISGKPATFSISATTDKPISQGKVVIDVFFFGVLIHKETHDLCEETTCPVVSGKFVLSHTQSLPGFTPPGMYTLKMSMVVGPDDQTLTCITFAFRIKFGSSVADS
ncbi:hypothetical protein H6P81_016605 [Aristolochia fimbriata]|uniref:MD-2-related lipid-recognition domain-containing protein n=1 Tax=Aristolochia fimbriata TaxID=158543 RepID=A0AAV7E8T1_ARIFI|nr:hypothetical protein H6P81_016605 [Aristolochia fimbriata]